jgi:hypothetical protein
MKYCFVLFGIATAMLCSSTAALAASSSIVISELQTGDATSLSNEFVELYNPLATDVDVGGWTLEYKSATGTSWSKKAILAGVVRSHGFYVLASGSYLATADGHFAAGLSGSAGHVRIKNSDGMVVDTLGWGQTANAAETMPVGAAAAGQSLERLPGRLLEEGGNATDTDDNSKDFVVRSAPMPQSAQSPIEVPGVLTEAPPEEEVDETGPPAPVYLPVMITELLIDPASPASDAKDEFVELFNPNSVDVDLQGYTLRAGSNYRDYFVLPAQIIKPGQYVVLLASQTRVSLTNTGGAAQLLDPLGTVVSQTGEYAKAETGMSWSLVDSEWTWSQKLTPAADNILDELPSQEERVAAAAKISKAKVTTTKPKATKITTKKEEVPKPKAKVATAKEISPLVAAVSQPASSWLLIVAGILTLGLIGFEFRHDIRNYYSLTRRKLGARPEHRP